MIVSQLAIISQGQTYLENISQQKFTEIIKPNFISSAGAHMRHIIDHYLAIISGFKTGLIDYDIRTRATELEYCPLLAHEKLTEIALWLGGLTENNLQKNIKLSTEISIKKQTVVVVNSSITRELIFASSHAIHHYAMIEQISHLQVQAQKVTINNQKTNNQNTQKNNNEKKDVLPHDFNSNFGIAPATASYLRKQATLKMPA